MRFTLLALLSLFILTDSDASQVGPRTNGADLFVVIERLNAPIVAPTCQLESSAVAAWKPLLQKWNQKIEELFGAKIELELQSEPCDEMAGPAAAQANPARVTYCPSFFRYLQTLGPERAKSFLAMVHFHEISHHFVGEQSERGNWLKLSEPLQKYYSEEDVEGMRWTRQHEVVDSLAAKMMREFGFTSRQLADGIVDFRAFSNFVIRDIPKEEVLPAYSQVIERRLWVFRESFDEGWLGWKNYLKLEPACEEKGLRGFFQARGYTALLKQTGGPLDACGPYSKEEVAQALDRGLEEILEFAPKPKK